MPTDGDLTYQQRARILRNVVLGVPAPRGETPAALAWRHQCERDAADCRAKGFMPEIPFDPTYGEED